MILRDLTNDSVVVLLEILNNLLYSIVSNSVICLDESSSKRAESKGGGDSIVIGNFSNQ